MRKDSHRGDRSDARLPEQACSALPPPTNSRSDSSISARSAISAGPISTTSGASRMVKEFGDKIETTFLENVSEGPDAERSIEQLARAGNKLIFTTSFGYMEPTLKVAKKYPERAFRARHRLQARQEHVDLFGALLRGPLHPGHDRRQDVEGRRARLYRLVPDSRSHLRHQRHDARRADDQPQHQGQDHLGEHLVRSRQGSRRRQGAARPGRRRDHAAHRLARPRCRSPPSAASWRSARIPK